MNTIAPYLLTKKLLPLMDASGRVVIKEGHVLVRVAATSVNTVDTMIRQMGQGLPLLPGLPAVLGMDCAETIEAVGAGVY